MDYTFKNRVQAMKTLIILLLTSTILQAQIPRDKKLHFIAGGVTSAIVYRIVDVNSNKNALIWGIASAVAIGTLKETYDFISYGKFDTKDLLATTLGGLTVSLTFELTKRKNRKL